MTPAAGLAALHALIGEAGQRFVKYVRWPRFLSGFDGAVRPLLRRMAEAYRAGASQREHLPPGSTLATRLREAPQPERLKQLTGFVATEVARIACLPSPDMIDVSAPLATLSIDSAALLANELPQVLQGGAANLERSDGQRALWFVYQLAPDSPVYKLSFRIQGGFDTAILRTAVRALTIRHLILRGTFAMRRDSIQQVPTAGDMAIEESTLPPSPKSIFASKHFRHRAAEPPLRVALFTQASDNHVVVVTIHHVVFDGSSIPVFFGEFKEGCLLRGRKSLQT